MGMTRQEFEQLVRRLEQVAAADKKSYRLKVALLAAGGYAFVVLVLAVLFGLVGLLAAAVVADKGSGAIQLIFALCVVAWAVLRGMWVRWPEPEGIRLRKGQAPRLFEEVNRIRRMLRTPRVHRIYLDMRYNASMEQRPRLGILGWPMGQMTVGLPLMLAVAPEEFRAVLAHEMGHLSREHGRIVGWIYRIRQTWTQILQ
jgi:Zn-dependent protease with chaperone function